MMGAVLVEFAETSGNSAALPGPACIPEEFSWTDDEKRKLVALARMLNCKVATAQELLIYFLRHIQDHPIGLPVAQLPELLAPFPVKWGFKKKRNDFLRLLCDLDFIYVKVNYWAKIRAKKYAPGKSGQELLDRLPRASAPVCLLDCPESTQQPYSDPGRRGDHPL